MLLEIVIVWIVVMVVGAVMLIRGKIPITRLTGFLAMAAMIMAVSELSWVRSPLAFAIRALPPATVPLPWHMQLGMAIVVAAAIAFGIWLGSRIARA